MIFQQNQLKVFIMVQNLGASSYSNEERRFPKSFQIWHKIVEAKRVPLQALQDIQSPSGLHLRYQIYPFTFFIPLFFKIIDLDYFLL